MHLAELKTIVADIKCSIAEREWTIVVDHMGDGFYIQLRYIEADIWTGNSQDQHGRKWYVSSYSTKSEVVQTVLKACLTSAEHMVREHFTYQGQRVFAPHFDIDQLVALAQTGNQDVRDEQVIKEKGQGQ